MKIRKIRFTKHPIFGDIELDFLLENGQAANTVIIAGENGVGKSLLLNTIFNFSNHNLENLQRDEQRFFEIELSDDELQNIKKLNTQNQFFTLDKIFTYISISFDFNIINDWRQIRIESFDEQGNHVNLKSHIFTSEAKKALKTIFSDTDINFKSNEIRNVTSLDIDKINIQSERTDINLATKIKQLLIDIQSIDALEFSEWARENPQNKVDIELLDSRIKRFSNAFSLIFPNKKYLKIVTENNQKNILFKENDRIMSIDNLSSGEKQIVFRGSFLLKDKESSEGAVILIDEPEISLHPSWQLKILTYFKKLFISQGEQKSQIIVATHSPFIIHNSNRNDDKIIVLKKDLYGKIHVSTNPVFFGWTKEQVIKDAFKVNHILINNKITVLLEGITDEKYYEKALKLFFNKENIEFKWIGRITEKGNIEFTGDSALNQARSFFLSNPQMIKGTVVLLYDNDTGKPSEDYPNLYIRSMSNNLESKIYKIGVESLLKLPEDFNYKQFYKVKKKINDYGAESIISDLDKVSLCNEICNSKTLQYEIVFSHIRNEIQRIIDTIDV